MRELVVFIISCLLAAAAPLVRPTANQTAGVQADFPSSFEGKALRELPLSEREQRFLANFPGRISRFSDGEREIVIRIVNSETRKLHPSSDCFRGLGYTVEPLPLETDDSGNNWGCFLAKNRSQALRICERVYDEEGQSWSDVSSWYWAAFVGRTQGPWWAVTVAERTGLNLGSGPSAD